MNDSTRMIIAVSLILVLAIVIGISYMKTRKTKGRISTKFIGRTAIFVAISTILYVVPYFQFNVPFFPAFLSIHFDEVPAAIAAFAYGPLSGFCVLALKTVIKLPFTSSLCVGEFADLLYGSVLILPGAFMYKKLHNFKGVAIGLLIGFVSEVVVAAFFTTFVILDFYMMVMGLPYEAILGMCQAINPSITDLTWPFFLYVGLPFNAFKNIIIVALIILLYKKIHTLVDKISFQNE